MLPRLLLPLLLLLGLLPALAGSGQAAESLRMTVRPGLDGIVKPGTWFPVEVQVANTGADVSGDIQIEIDGIDNRGAFNRPPVVFSTPAVLPRQSSKRFVLEVYLPGQADKLTAKLVSDGNVVTEAEGTFDRVGQTELLCGVLSGNRNSLDFLPGIELAGRQRHIRVAHLDVVDLPSTPHLLSALDCLVVSNVGLTGIGDQQREALHAWTAAGGLLVVAGGPGWQKTLAGLPPELLPVQAVGTVPLRSAHALESFAGVRIESPGPWLVAETKPTDGAVVLAEDGLPLVVAARRGQGAVVFLAFDPSLEPLRSWRGSAQLWRHLVGYAPAQVQLPSNMVRPYSGWGRFPRNALADLSPLRPPTADGIPALLLLYGLAIGPLTYLGLRRIGRLEWILWVAPVLTAIVAAGAFGVAQSRSESDIVFNKISLVRAWDLAADGYARTYVAAFSPRENTYDIGAVGQSGPVDGLVFPMYRPFPVATGTPAPSDRRVVVQRGGATELTGYVLPAHSMGTFYVDSRAPLGSGLGAELTFGSGSVAGAIANGGERLTDAALVVGSEVVRLGDLAPQERRQVVVPLGEGAPFGYVDLPALVRQLYPNPAVATPVSTNEAMRREILDSALGWGFSFATRLELSPVTLVGWLERGPVTLQPRKARGAELDRALLVASLPVGVGAGEEMTVPGALIERRNLIAGSGRVTQSGLSLSNGDALQYEYLLPERPDRFAIEELVLDVNSPSLGGAPLDGYAQLSVYDWPTGDWVERALDRQRVPLGEPGRVVSALGQIRLRLVYRSPNQSSAGSSLQLDRFDLSVRGRAV